MCCLTWWCSCESSSNECVQALSRNLKLASILKDSLMLVVLALWTSAWKRSTALPSLKTPVVSVELSLLLMKLVICKSIEEVERLQVVIQYIYHSRLGAVHDGSPPPSYLGGPGAEKCRWEDGYIMSDLRHTERGFRWSPCSVQSFHHFLK